MSITLTAHLASFGTSFDDAFEQGVILARAGIRPTADYRKLALVRSWWGFVELEAPLTTPAKANHKLAGAVIPSIGLTLNHVKTVMPARTVVVDGVAVDLPRLIIDACPFAGDCIKVCVLNNGHGRWDSTKRAWRWRTEFACRFPESFARVLAWELVRAVVKHGAILFRPNVNSDAQWELLLPSLTSGAVLPEIVSYGYSKVPSTLDGDGWLGAAYRVAFSWNESADASRVAAFVARGGSVAVVSSRAKGAPVLEHLPFDYGTAPVVDADVTDEWMLASHAVVGDLSAKGAARKLIGKSAFVVVPLTSRKRLALLAVA